ncbi:MAG: radical SAM protein [DPANN group archaeon]|nr:radical SAM protein [DPANN group archaeon]
MRGWIRYAVEEFRLVRSLSDLEKVTRKLVHLRSRLPLYRGSRSSVPLCLQIEPTNHCNVNCICCSRERMERERGFMDPGLFRKIIDEGAAVGIRRVHLYLHGEPLLNPHIVDMISHIKSRGLAFTLATNGMLLDREKAEGILSAGVDNGDHFMVSILGHSKAVHEGIMRGVDHERVRRNLLAFLELRRSAGLNGPVIETVFYQMPENEKESKEFYRFWSGTVDHVRMRDRISEQFARFKSDDGFIRPRAVTCRNLWERMTVFWNGDVTLCTADLDGTTVFGSLGSQPIREVWNSDALLSIKGLHREKKFHSISLCSNCDQ